MTTTTPKFHRGRRSGRSPPVGAASTLAVAFIVGLLLATITWGAGALYAYDQQYVGRVLPGVPGRQCGPSGLEPAVAAERLRKAYGSLGEGEITLKTPEGKTTISFADIGRGPDVDAMLAEAAGRGTRGEPGRAGHRRRPNGHPRRDPGAARHLRPRRAR